TQQRKPLTKKHQREFYTSVLRNQAGWKARDFKGMTLEDIKENFDPVWKQIRDFIPIGSKEEAERFKRKGIRFEQESLKKLKTSEEVKETEEVPEDKVKETMQLVLVEEVYVEALQVKHPIIDWKHLDSEDLNQLWRLVKETLSIRPPTSDEEMEIWFWSTARIETTEDGTKILAIVDGKLRTVSESSIRRNLKLNDEAGIISNQWKYLIHTIMQCLSHKSTGFNEFSSNIPTALGKGLGTPTESHHTPSPEAQQPSSTTHSSSSLLPITTATIPPGCSLLSSSPVVDEPASPLEDDSQGEACPTDSGFEADQDRANIAKTSTLPSDSTPRVTSLVADEGMAVAKVRPAVGITSLSVGTPVAGRPAVGTTSLPMGTSATLLDKTVVASMEGKGSGTPTESHHTPSPEAQQPSSTTHSSSSLPPITTATIPPVILTESLPTIIPSDNPPLRQYTRRTRVAHSSVLPPVADEPASPLEDDSQGEACPTGSGFEADQDRANIAKTSTLPSDSTPRVTSLVADEGTQELEINRLKAKVKLLKDKEGGGIAQSGHDVPIKGRSLDEGEEAAEKGSNDTEEMINVLTSMDATTFLSSRVAEVPIGSDVVPTAGLPATGVPTDSDVIPTAGLTFATATVTQQRKPLTKKQQREFYTSVLRNQAGWKARDFKGMTLEDIKENFDPVWKQIHDFIPIGSKEEAERFKRKGIRFEQESLKKLKTSEELKETEEVPEDKLKETMQLVLVEEVYVEALQVKHPIIDWKVHTEGQRSFWKIIRLRGSSASYQFFVDMLKHLDKDFPTASEESSHCQKKRDATTEKIALLLKSSSNCQSKSYDSYAKLVPHV
nr:hypothetical protein [Tanacetum cinerariifolium]